MSGTGKTNGRKGYELAGENYSIPKYVKELANQFMAEQYDAEYSGLYFLSKSA